MKEGEVATHWGHVQLDITLKIVIFLVHDHRSAILLLAPWANYNKSFEFRFIFDFLPNGCVVKLTIWYLFIFKLLKVESELT